MRGDRARWWGGMKETERSQTRSGLAELDHSGSRDHPEVVLLLWIEWVAFGAFQAERSRALTFIARSRLGCCFENRSWKGKGRYRETGQELLQ